MNRGGQNIDAQSKTSVYVTANLTFNDKEIVHLFCNKVIPRQTT